MDVLINAKVLYIYNVYTKGEWKIDGIFVEEDWLVNILLKKIDEIYY